MSPVHKLSQMGSLTTNKIDYPSMLAGYGDFGAMQRIGYSSLSGTGTFTFSSIPQTFQDLILVLSTRASASAFQTGTLRLNSDTGSNYSTTLLEGNGSTISSTRYTNETFIRVGNAIGSSETASAYATCIIQILNYSNITTNKTTLCRDASDKNGSGIVQFSVGLWRNTAAVTSVNYATSLTTGSTAALYGVRSSAS